LQGCGKNVNVGLSSSSDVQDTGYKVHFVGANPTIPAFLISLYSKYSNMRKRYQVLYEVYTSKVIEALSRYPDGEEIPEYVINEINSAIRGITIYLKHFAQSNRDGDIDAPYRSWYDLIISFPPVLANELIELGLSKVDAYNTIYILSVQWHTNNLTSKALETAYFDELDELNHELVAINKIKQEELKELEKTKQDLTNQIGFDAS
jgi:hypothetical protein